MNPTDKNKLGDPHLRVAAEAKLKSASMPQTPEHSGVKLLHELQVHQIELDLQNEVLRETQIELVESRDRYEDLFDFAPVGYFTISAEGKIANINLSGAALLGETREKLLQIPFERFVWPEDEEHWHLYLASVLKQDEKLDCELALKRGDGVRVYARMNSRRLIKDGQPATARVVLTDITELKRIAAEHALLDKALREKNAELESARFVAEKANLAKSDFLSSMSHELRTPLNAILGFAQLIESGKPEPTPNQQRSLDQILKGGWYLLELINEILDLALIESGKATLSREPVSLNEVMLECRAMIEPQAQNRGIKLTFPRFEFPCFVNADRTRLKQVLINLLSNALKYNKPDGTIVVDCAPSPLNSIRISIRDSGAGLAPEQLAQLFQSFNRLGKEVSGEQGTGIGLVVTKRLVELMGGVIGVDSTVGMGSVFWIKLTMASAPQLVEAEDARVAQLHPPLPEGTPLRTLLYVEDNPANQELVEQLVARRDDLRLLCAADGILGIEMARIHRPEVILMDIKLPGISGLEAMKILRADPVTAHIPIIALSANAVHRDIKKGIEAGFFNYLTKPIKVGQFMEALDLALEVAKTGPRLSASPSK
ncbi:MAG: ATP-binding protein [Proteobacteria bacterium]|nr:ATP-binding protein [Pseudomonadota bacterium]